MIELVAVLTAASMFIEYKIVMAVPAFRRYIGRYSLLSLAFSLGLSMILGMFFGAAGLLVFVAGICSTMLMQPVYFAIRTGQIDKLHKAGNNAKVQWDDHWEGIRATGAALWSVVMLLVKVITVIFAILATIVRAIGWVADRLNGTTVVMPEKVVVAPVKPDFYAGPVRPRR